MLEGHAILVRLIAFSPNGGIFPLQQNSLALERGDISAPVESNSYYLVMTSLCVNIFNEKTHLVAASSPRNCGANIWLEIPTIPVFKSKPKKGVRWRQRQKRCSIMVNKWRCLIGR
jgi:hypothetical protein